MTLKVKPLTTCPLKLLSSGNRIWFFYRIAMDLNLFNSFKIFYLRCVFHTAYLYLSLTVKDRCLMQSPTLNYGPGQEIKVNFAHSRKAEETLWIGCNYHAEAWHIADLHNTSCAENTTAPVSLLYGHRKNVEGLHLKGRPGFLRLLTACWSKS